MSRFGPLVEVHPTAFIHPTALIYGKVTVGPEASIWPHAVIRAELHEVVIGEAANIQDFVMIHVGYETPTIIGARCSVTHHATIHGATLEDDVLVGINVTVMDGARVGAGSIVAGHAIVTEGTAFPAHSVIAGAPATLKTTRDSTTANQMNAEFYRKNAQAYARGAHRIEDW